MHETTRSFEHEVLRSIEPIVADNLILLVGDRRKWWASNFFGFMEGEDDSYKEPLAKLREEAQGLSDEQLVVLVGNEVTEEALPNYARRVALMFPDPTGTSENPWNVWERGWVAEEKMHGRVLDRYLFLTGRVNQDAVDSSIDSLIRNGMKGEPSTFRTLLYPAFQEPATALSHKNMANSARMSGVDTLHSLCSKIAADEMRHATFYERVSAGLMEVAPEETMIAYEGLMKDKVVMPALNMTDESNPVPPTLFEHFSGVASKIGVYTTHDYATLVDKLNKKLQVGKVAVTGAAAKAQEYLSGLPKRLHRLAERNKNRVADPVGFNWIYGRSA